MDTIVVTGGLLEVAIRLAAAVLIGSALGVNRDLRDKPAGLRTHALVTLGSALITIVSIELATSAGGMDGSGVLRTVQGVITGIGFLGAGVIMRDSDGGTVRGLTTAASIWIAACLGIGCGAGQWHIALIGVGLTLVVLVLGGPVEGAIYRRLRSRRPD